MIRNILILFGITMIPAFELRASIPYGILSGRVDLPLGLHVEGMGMWWLSVLAICVASNAILGFILYPLIDKIMQVLSKIPLIGKLWNRFTSHAQKKVHPYVEKWGTLGIAIFVAIPLPGSGSYSGAVGAYLLGMSKRNFYIANTIGVFLAGVAVTAATIAGRGIFEIFF